MEPFTLHTGLAVVIDRTNIDTDQIIPKQFLSRVTKDGFGVNLFHDWRYLDEGGNIANPDFELNQPRYKGATILVANENFGCGSSREHAPWALADFGFKVILAPSFGDIFYNNSLNNGLLPVKLADNEISLLMSQITQNQGARLTIDLDKQKVIAPNGEQFDFQIAQSARHNLLNGLDAIGLSLAHEQAITEHENNLPCWR